MDHGLSGIDGLWKGDKAVRGMSGEAGISVLDEAKMIDGAVGSTPTDRTSGMYLGIAGEKRMNLTAAAAGNTEVLEAKMKIGPALGLHDSIEYILRAQHGQHHCRSVKADDALFAYLAHSKANSNLAMPHRLRNVDDAKLN
jgi:hypothetical protein